MHARPLVAPRTPSIPPQGARTSRWSWRTSSSTSASGSLASTTTAPSPSSPPTETSSSCPTASTPRWGPGPPEGGGHGGRGGDPFPPTQVKPLIWIESVIEKFSHSRVEIMVKVRRRGGHRRHGGPPAAPDPPTPRSSPPQGQGPVQEAVGGQRGGDRRAGAQRRRLPQIQDERGFRQVPPGEEPRHLDHQILPGEVAHPAIPDAGGPPRRVFPQPAAAAGGPAPSPALRVPRRGERST